MRLLHPLALPLALALCAATAGAQGYPDKSRTIKIIVPAGAASVTDLLARAYARQMAAVAGLNVVVENKPGAELLVGTQAVMMAPPDGYTMMFTTSSGQTLNPVVLPNLPYDPIKDFTPLVAIGKASLVMNLGASTTFKSAHEFIAAAKAKPGKYTCASASTTTRMSCEFLQATAGVKILNVPYKTTAAAMTAVASGEADTIFVDVGSAKAQWESGRVRGVAATGLTRMPTLPQLPTLREDGAPGYDITAWYATYFPAKTPPEIAATMRAILKKVGATKEIADTLTSYAMEPLPLEGDALAEYNQREIDAWKKLVRTANIKITN